MNIKTFNPEFTYGSCLSIEFLNIKHQQAHSHPDTVEIVFCLSGTVNVKIAHEEYIMAAGDMITLDHLDYHAMWSDEDNIVLVLHLDASSLSDHWHKEKYYLFSCASPLYRPQQQASFTKVCCLVLSAGCLVLEEVSDNSLYDMIAAKIYEILVADFQWFCLSDLTSEENEKFQPRINKVLEYVTQHYPERITLSMVADEVYVDRNYLSQFLKRTTFNSFSQTVIYTRCYNAEKFLLETDKSVQEISDLCGFSSQKYFHKGFKSFWNITPLQHRLWYEKYSSKPEQVSPCAPEECLHLTIKTLVAIQLHQI